MNTLIIYYEHEHCWQNDPEEIKKSVKIVHNY